MADERPPLRLQFTVQGAKRVLPLSSDNVTSVLSTVGLTKTNRYGRTFGWLLDIPRSTTDPFSAAAWWLREGKDRRWRKIIYSLDRLGETELVDYLVPYSEQPSDPSLTVARVTPILMELKNWKGARAFTIGDVMLVPEPRSDIIRRQHTATEGQKEEAARYYVTCSPFASWGNLAWCLYYAHEENAMEAFRTHLPKPRDPTLTMGNMLQATDGVEMSKQSFTHLMYLDVPVRTYNELMRTSNNGREAVFAEFLSHHPYPRWELVVDLLEKLEKMGRARAGLAQEVKEKYLTNVRSLFSLCVSHIVNNCEFYQPLLPQLLPHHIHTHINHVLQRTSQTSAD